MPVLKPYFNGANIWSMGIAPIGNRYFTGVTIGLEIE